MFYCVKVHVKNDRDDWMERLLMLAAIVRNLGSR